MDDTGASTKDAVDIAGVKGRLTPGWQCHNVPFSSSFHWTVEISVVTGPGDSE